MEYYYTAPENIDKKGNKLELNEFEYKHLVKVLRKKEGDKITVTDGQLNIYECIISGISKDKIHCEILKTGQNLYEPDKHISLFLSPLRNQDRFEFAVEKAVELGVHCITPVITKRTVARSSFSNNKISRLEKIIIGAIGQSQRCYLPKLNNTGTLDEIIDGTKNVISKVVMYELAEGEYEYVEDKGSKDIALLIGPEGGFSEEEINKLKNNGWQALSLGERKLRAETAAIVSIFKLLSK